MRIIRQSVTKIKVKLAAVQETPDALVAKALKAAVHKNLINGVVKKELNVGSQKESV